MENIILKTFVLTVVIFVILHIIRWYNYNLVNHHMSRSNFYGNHWSAVTYHGYKFMFLLCWGFYLLYHILNYYYF